MSGRVPSVVSQLDAVRVHDYRTGLVDLGLRVLRERIKKVASVGAVGVNNHITDKV